MDPLVEPVKAGAQGRLIQPGLGVTAGVGQEVAGDLLQHEAVVGKVGVEGPDDVIPVAVGQRDVVIKLMPGTLGEPSQVEPVPRPALAVVGRGEQPIDQPGISVGRGIGHERLDLGGLGRQADQVEGQAADQGPTVGFGRGLETLRLQLRQDEAVDRVARPRLVLDLGRRGIFDRLEAPVSGALAEVERSDLRGRAGLGRHRPGGSALDPLGQDGDLLGRELGLRRHPEVFGVADGLDQEALLGLAGEQGRAGVATFQGVGQAIEPQAPLGLALAVAREAAVGQQRADLRLEERDPRRIGGVLSVGQGKGQHEGQGGQRSRPRHRHPSRVATPGRTA